MSKHKALEMSIKANCMRILEILDLRDLEQLKQLDNNYNRLEDCVELNKRMAQLRKDTLKAQKILYSRQQ